MKRTVDAFDYAGHICKSLRKGVLLTTASGDTVNTMTIGWGCMGIEWNRPVFITYVRESRYTREILKENPEFTVNVPYGEFDSRILSYCGKASGREVDKIKTLGLTLVSSDQVSVPGIQELPLTLECRVIYQKKQDAEDLPESIRKRFYPTDENGQADEHIAFYGEIVNAYIAE